MPGSLSIIQYTENATFSHSERELAKNVYMWKATFNTANLYDIHVKECEFGHSDRIRIELTATCKVPPAGQGLMTAAGVKGADMMDRAVETSNSVASSVAIANIADRWLSGEQEIKLTFIRRTQLSPRGKVWIWDAVVAFVCGAEWAAQDRHALDVVAQKSLKEVANARSGSPFAEFEVKEDDWVLIKPYVRFKILPYKSTTDLATRKPLRLISWASVQDTEQQHHTARGLHFEMMQSETVASPLRIGSPAVGEVTALGSLMGKRKAEEQVENPRWEKKVRLESRERLKEKLAEVQGELRAWQEAESYARDMAEKARDTTEKARDKTEKAKYMTEKARDMTEEARDMTAKAKDMAEKAGDMAEKAKDMAAKAAEKERGLQLRMDTLDP